MVVSLSHSSLGPCCGTMGKQSWENKEVVEGSVGTILTEQQMPKAHNIPWVPECLSLTHVKPLNLLITETHAGDFSCPTALPLWFQVSYYSWLPQLLKFCTTEESNSFLFGLWEGERITKFSLTFPKCCMCPSIRRQYSTRNIHTCMQNVFGTCGATAGKTGSRKMKTRKNIMMKIKRMKKIKRSSDV